MRAVFAVVFGEKNRGGGRKPVYDIRALRKIGLSKGDNLLLFSKGRAEKTLEKSPYIASAKLSAKLPHTMKITIKERKARGYVPYMGSYLYIDEEGRVLEVAGSCRWHCRWSRG